MPLLRTGWRAFLTTAAGSDEQIPSRAKDDFVNESDVDLAYVLTGSDPGEVLAYSMFECTEWGRELQAIIGAPVQLEMADPLTDTVVWPAVREHGQPIRIGDKVRSDTNQGSERIRARVSEPLITDRD